jgi:hypothetical protein
MIKSFLTMRYRTLFALIVLCNTGCQNNNFVPVNLSESQEYSLGKSRTELTLIKSYINDKDCGKVNEAVYANAFICKVDDKPDTIIVFSICSKAYKFLRNDYKGPRWLIIDSSKVVQNHPSIILSNIDKSILLRKYRYVIGDINNLED